MHKLLMEYRNELFAHTDYRRYRPAVGRWTMENNSLFPMSFRAPDFTSLEQSLHQIGELIDAVDGNLTQLIRGLEAEG
jgi:hypothetical protein